MKHGQNSSKMIGIAVAVVILLMAILYFSTTDMGSTKEGWSTFLEGFKMMRGN